MNDDSNERAKIGGRMFADLSQAQVSFSMKAMQCLFVLNGGAATAILASHETSFFSFACWYGIGAVFAIASLAAGYFACSAIGESWRDYFEEVEDPASHWQRFYKKGKWSLRAAVGLFVASMLFFLIPTTMLFFKFI